MQIAEVEVTGYPAVGSTLQRDVGVDLIKLARDTGQLKSSASSVSQVVNYPLDHCGAGKAVDGSAETFFSAKENPCCELTTHHMPFYIVHLCQRYSDIIDGHIYRRVGVLVDTAGTGSVSSHC